MTELLERQRELAELCRAVDDVRAGNGRLVVIEAKAGLGKTRLLAATRELAADAGLRVLAGRATELERDFPFALVRQLFELPLTALPQDQREPLFDGANAALAALGLGGELNFDRDAFAVLHGLYWLTAALAEDEPLMLAIDDAHWADAASLDYLGFLLPRLEELRVLVVVTSRPDEPDLPVGLGRIVTDPSAWRVTPAALSREAVAELLARELGRRPDGAFAGACHEVSGGNPFLVCELARTLAEQEITPDAAHAPEVLELAPERVTRMVLLRLDRLPEAAGAVARAVAVLGDDSDLLLVAELGGIDPETGVSAADALRAGAIFDPGASLRFVHPLVRNAVYAQVPAGERAAAHAGAAALLQARQATPERVATQLVATDPRGERATVETLLEAAERALAGGAPRSAIAYLSRALREPPPPELRSTVLSELMTAGTRAADYATLTAIEGDVLAELERDPSLRGEWAIPLTLWMVLSGRLGEAAALLVRGIEVAVAEDDVERAFQLEAQLSTISLLMQTPPEVDLERYADRIDPDSPTGRLAAAMEVRSAVVDGTAAEAIVAAKRALGRDAVIFSEEPELAASSVAVMTLVAADDVDTAQYAARRALEIARERGATPDLVRAHYLNGFVAWGRGDFAAAEADVRQAIELARLSGLLPLALMYTGSLVEILIERDELDAAEAELEAIGMTAGPIPSNALFSMLQVIRVHLHYERGRFEAAAEDFRALSAAAESLGVGVGPTITACQFAARTLVALGEPEQACELAESMIVHAERWGAPATIAQVLRARAVAAEGAARVELLHEAVAVLDGSPRRFQRAEALSELGTALRRQHRGVEAREPLREALELARRCGAARLARRTQEELLASGERVRRHSPIGAESLSPAERRVAELAATGLTNRRIAQDLFVTVKTVEAHLSACYDKLGIRSRRQLPSALGG